MAKKESAESSEIPWPYAVNRTWFLSVYNQIVVVGVSLWWSLALGADLGGNFNPGGRSS